MGLLNEIYPKKKMLAKSVDNTLVTRAKVTLLHNSSSILELKILLVLLISISSGIEEKKVIYGANRKHRTTNRSMFCVLMIFLTHIVFNAILCTVSVDVILNKMKC